MLRPYRVLITTRFLAFPKPSGRGRARILAFLDSLASDPFQKGDYEETDAVGRPVFIKVISSYALTFWTDHGAEEVKVVRVERADLK